MKRWCNPGAGFGALQRFALAGLCPSAAVRANAGRGKSKTPSTGGGGGNSGSSPPPRGGCSGRRFTLPELHGGNDHLDALRAAGLAVGHSAPREASQSLFEAYAAVGDVTAEHVEQLVALAMAIATPDATHPRMLGYRLASGKTGCDDDGEKGAGRRLEAQAAAISAANGGRGVALVVTRYFGGVMLGKKRWVLIAAVADDAAKNATAHDSATAADNSD